MTRGLNCRRGLWCSKGAVMELLFVHWCIVCFLWFCAAGTFCLRVVCLDYFVLGGLLGCAAKARSWRKPSGDQDRVRRPCNSRVKAVEGQRWQTASSPYQPPAEWHEWPPGPNEQWLGLGLVSLHIRPPVYKWHRPRSYPVKHLKLSHLRRKRREEKKTTRFPWYYEPRVCP